MRINDRYSVTRDVHGWTLVEHAPATTRKGEASVRVRRTYYATLEQALVEVLDRTAGQCERARVLRAAFASAVQEIREALAEHGHVRATERDGEPAEVREG